LATLVPEGEVLQIEARLPIGEVGYVSIGSPARLSIAAGGSGFSTIAAKVVHVSPDAVVDEKTGASYYVVRLIPETLAFRNGNNLYALRPGVQVSAAILTGHRSVIALLLDPFMGHGIRPLTER
jgi:adhesin transport system membrane fusion protein